MSHNIDNQKRSDFERFLYEAPDSDPPDIDSDVPPDIDETSNADNDASENIDMGGGDEAPPDIDASGGDDGFGDFTDDPYNDNNNAGSEDGTGIDGLDEKVSAIMNEKLFRRFSSLLNTINSEITMLQKNSDVLYSISDEIVEVLDKLKKLDQNIRIYIKNTFMDENYSTNRLFFNKCLNLLNLLNIVFNKAINKGMKNSQ